MHEALKNKSLVIAIGAVVVAAIVVFGWIKHSESRRYYMVPGKDGIAYKIDRKTGKTWHMKGGKLEEVSDRNPKTTTHRLPSYITSEITGKGGYSGTSFFEGDLYNPTDYYIDSVTFIVQNKKEGDEKWRREFTDSVRIPPKSTGSFLFDTLDGDKAEAESWGIESATGHIPD